MLKSLRTLHSPLNPFQDRGALADWAVLETHINKYHSSDFWQIKHSHQDRGTVLCTKEVGPNHTDGKQGNEANENRWDAQNEGRISVQWASGIQEISLEKMRRTLFLEKPFLHSHFLYSSVALLPRSLALLKQMIPDSKQVLSSRPICRFFFLSHLFAEQAALVVSCQCPTHRVDASCSCRAPTVGTRQNGEQEMEEEAVRKWDGGRRKRRKKERRRASQGASEIASAVRGRERGLNGFQAVCTAE